MATSPELGIWSREGSLGHLGLPVPVWPLTRTLVPQICRLLSTWGGGVPPSPRRCFTVRGSSTSTTLTRRAQSDRCGSWEHGRGRSVARTAAAPPGGRINCQARRGCSSRARRDGSGMCMCPRLGRQGGPPDQRRRGLGELSSATTCRVGG